MSVIDDAQTLSIYNGKGQALPGAIAENAGLPEVITAVSGTPFQISTRRAAELYIAIATSAALTVSMGPEAAGTSVPVAASASEAIGVTTLYVPAGWYVKLTGTVANFVLNAVLR